MAEILTQHYHLVIENNLVYTSQTYDIENYVAERISNIVKIDQEERRALLPDFKESYRVFPEPGFVLTQEQEKRSERLYGRSYFVNCWRSRLWKNYTNQTNYQKLGF